MIIQTVNADTFVRAFDEMNRGNNFSNEARYALFDYYDDYSESVGEAFELDVIAICCDFSEYDLQLAIDELDHVIDQDELDECEDDGEKLDYLEQALQDHTMVIRVEHCGAPDTLIVQAF